MIGCSHSIVNNEIGLKSSIEDIGNCVISRINAYRNRQTNPMLMV